MTLSMLPAVNATLNSIAAILLVLGFINIKKSKKERHKKFMLAALIVSIAFLTTYLYYHYYAGSTPYPHHDWTRALYFSILIPHIILAALMSPFIIIVVVKAWTGAFQSHKKLARFVWPVWLFVSISGVIVYLMLYQF
jgi:putative membrane protein